MEQNRFSCGAFSLCHITTLEQVDTFFDHVVINLKVNFHPDDDFADYVDTNTNIAVFSKEEAALANRLLNECFDVCQHNNIDIYGIAFTRLKRLVELECA